MWSLRELQRYPLDAVRDDDEAGLAVSDGMIDAAVASALGLLHTHGGGACVQCLDPVAVCSRHLWECGTLRC